MDIDPSLIEPRVKEIKLSDVTFVTGDSSKIENCFLERFFQRQASPLACYQGCTGEFPPVHDNW